MQILGEPPAKLPSTKLPTISDVLKAIYFELKVKLPAKDAIKIVANQIKGIWQNTTIPTLTVQRIVVKLTDLYAAHNKVAHAIQTAASEEKKISFKADAQHLFDIAYCKCANSRSCNCADNKKIPSDEYAFYIDQKSKRRQVLKVRSVQTSEIRELSPKPIDIDATTEGSDAAMSVDESFDVIDPGSSDISHRSPDASASGPSGIGLSDASAPEPSGMNLRSRFIEVKFDNIPHYNTVKLYQVPIAADRYNVSDQAAAAIATATLIDYGLVTPDSNLLVVDRKKVQRSRRNLRLIQSENLSFEELHGFYFDGRGDKTMVYENKRIKNVKEEHVSFVQEPHSYFLGHTTISNKTGLAIAESIDRFVTEKEIPKEHIKLIGCDGTVTNTGVDNGAIRCVEKEWKKALQWCVCLLHMNELPLRALFSKLDGSTSGPESFSGPLGKRIQKCDGLDVVQFEPIDFPCALDVEEIKQDLSSDQQLLFEICIAISNGTFSENLKNRKIGPVAHSRWLTTAMRILRTYVSDEEPSANLKNIATYIVQVYAPAIYNIKYKSSIVYGPIHLAQIVKSAQRMPPECRAILNRNISNNCYFAHAENITLAMLNDDSEAIRLNAWDKIFVARQQEIENSLRQFRSPQQLNFACESYTQLIDYENAEYFNPPILKDYEFTEDQIVDLASKPILEHNFGKYLKDIPCHTQAVERSVKLVTEASQRVCGQEGRNGFIFNTLSSRRLMPMFESKQDFTIAPDIATTTHFHV